MLDLRSIARALGGEVSGGQVLAPGPGHAPKDRSLSVKLDDKGEVIVHSFAGDDWKRCKDHVKAKLGIEAKPNGGGPKVVTRYDYVGEGGEPLFQVERLEPKGFRQRAANGAWKLDGVRRVPYRLPELLQAASEAKTIFIAEGEKAVDALVKIGVVATCSPGGAGKWKPEYAQHFAGAGDVIILPDNDDVGEKHAADILQTIPCARVVRLPGLPDKGDVYDWIQSGGTVDQLMQAEADQPANLPLDVPDLKQWLGRKIPPRDLLCGTFLSTTSRILITGPTGLGKTMLGIALAIPLAAGAELVAQILLRRRHRRDRRGRGEEEGISEGFRKPLVPGGDREMAGICVAYELTGQPAQTGTCPAMSRLSRHSGTRDSRDTLIWLCPVPSRWSALVVLLIFSRKEFLVRAAKRGQGCFACVLRLD